MQPAGTYPMLYAFFDAAGRLRRDAFSRQVAAALACGASGIAVLGLGLQNVVLALAATFAGMFARVTRGDVLNIRSEPYVEAAQLMGVRGPAVIGRHLLPNVLSPIIVQFGLDLAVAILLESGLSFLGLGVPPPEPDLGLMIAEGRGFIVMAPWISGFPGLALVVIIVGLNLFGDGLRDALDPKAQIS